MSKRRCYVYNCPSRGPGEEKNLSMFTVPTDDESFALWKSVIPQGPRELTKNSHICEYHFDKSCVNWTTQMTLPDGSVVDVQLKKPRMRRGSIPTIFDSSLYEAKEKRSTEAIGGPNVASTSTSLSPQSKSTFHHSGHICSVSSCMYAIRRNVTANASISFHKFPKDPVLRKVWVQRCLPTESQAAIEYRRVCSIHFEDRFVRTASNKKKLLAKNCTPTLNLPPSHVPVDENEPDEPDPLAQPSFEMTEDTPSSPMRDPTGEYLSDEDTLVIDETPDPESSDVSEAPIDPLPGPPPPPDPLIQVKPVPKKGRPFGSKSNVAIAARKNLNASMNSLLNSSPEERDRPNTSDVLSKRFETIDFDPYSLEKFDLQDPLEIACSDPVWRQLNNRARKAVLRANFKRISYLLPEDHKRSNTTEILTSALEYLEWVGKNNSSLALMNEMLSQKHYAMRTKQERLARLLVKSNAARKKV